MLCCLRRKGSLLIFSKPSQTLSCCSPGFMTLLRATPRPGFSRRSVGWSCVCVQACSVVERWSTGLLLLDECSNEGICKRERREGNAITIVIVLHLAF